MRSSEKLILNGTSNDGKRHRYSFDKNEKFKIAFLKFMTRLGFKKEVIEEIKKKFISTTYNEKDEEIIINLKISKMQDISWYFKNVKYEVDVFFGLKKIIVIVRIKRKKNRENLLNNLQETTEWISEEEIKRRNKKRKEVSKLNN